MVRKQILGIVLVGFVLVLVAGAAFITGVGPAPGGADGDAPITDFPTATPSDPRAQTTSTTDAITSADTTETNTNGSTSESPTGSSTKPFAFTVDAIEECGQTCRDVTASLHNNQDDTATRITVFTRIYAGQNNTNPDDIVWESKEDVGSIEGGASRTMTKRVELSLREGLKIERENGWITIVTTVESDQHTVTFTDTQQVA